MAVAKFYLNKHNGNAETPNVRLCEGEVDKTTITFLKVKLTADYFSKNLSSISLLKYTRD